jgi:hypothetical protein
MKLPDFESPSGDSLSKSANFGLSKWIFFVKNHPNLSKKNSKKSINYQFRLGFPTGRDTATFWDNGTEVSLLSRDNGTSSKSCHGTGRAGTASQNMGRDMGRDRVLIFCHGTGREGFWQPVLSRKIPGQPRDRWEKRVKKLEKLKKKKNYIFFFFLHFFVPGQRSLSRDRTGLDSQSKYGTGRGTGQVNFFCPGTKGQENFFVLGQRDNRTSRPGLSRDVPRDVPSLGNPNLGTPF